MSISLRWFLVAAVGLLTPACNAVIVNSYPNLPANFADGDFERATAKGAIATTVVGNPFAAAGAGNFGDEVRSLMKNQVGVLPVEFVPQQGANTTKPYKVVVVFNPRRGMNDDTICQMDGKTPTAEGNPGQVSTAMVFCDGDVAKSGTSGHVSGVRDRNDPKFASLVRQVASLMIPSSGLLKQLRRDNVD